MFGPDPVLTRRDRRIPSARFIAEFDGSSSRPWVAAHLVYDMRNGVPWPLAARWDRACLWTPIVRFLLVPQRKSGQVWIQKVDQFGELQVELPQPAVVGLR